MGNQPSSSSGITGNLMLAGIGITAVTLAWKHGIFKRAKKEIKDSLKEAAAYIVIWGIVILGFMIILLLALIVFVMSSKWNNEEFPPQSHLTSALIDDDSTDGHSESLEEICDSVSSAQIEIKIMTYNLCHPKKESLRGRMMAVTSLVRRYKPDVVLFQEATPQIEEILRSLSLWDSYECVAHEANCMVFSILPTNSLRPVPFTDGGKLLLTKTEFPNGTDLFIATSHLKCTTGNSKAALKDCKKRMSQAKEAIANLHNCQNIILGGDMNWRNTDGRFPLKPGWIDAWEHIKPHEPGYTFDTETNPLLKGRKRSRQRFDRFLCKLNNFELVSIEIIGKEAVPLYAPCNSYEWVTTSDHYGLVLTVRTI